MKKRVAVQEGLHEAAELLKEKGYSVTNIDESKVPIDVIIYSNGNKEYLSHNIKGEMEMPSNNQFVKMINIDEVGIEELINKIEEID